MAREFFESPKLGFLGSFDALTLHTHEFFAFRTFFLLHSSQRRKRGSRSIWLATLISATDLSTPGVDMSTLLANDSYWETGGVGSHYFSLTASKGVNRDAL